MVREFKLPDVGEGLTEAEIVNWLVEVGDTVTEDQPVAEVETDKAVVEVPSPVNGTVREILAEEGEMVPVGEVIITFDVEGEAVEEPAETETAAEDEPEPAVTPAEDGETQTETEAEPTSKGGRVFAAPSTRQLARKLGVDIEVVAGSGPGGRITEGDVRSAAEGGSEAESEADSSEGASSDGAKSATRRVSDESETVTETEPKPTTSGEVADRERTLAAPATRKLAEEKGVDLDSVPTEETRDGEAFATPEAVEAYAEAQQAAQQADAEAVSAGAAGDGETVAAPSGEDERIPYRGIRRTIGKQMERSKFTAPHVTHHDEVDVTRLVETRGNLKAEAEERGTKLSYMPFVMKAVVAGLKQHPMLNAQLDEENEEIVVRGEYNIGVAAATEAGLMVPVVKGVDRKGMLDIAEEMNELVEKARDRSIAREEMQGGTFSITNFGAIGGEYATPIINYPESAILGLGAIKDKPRVIDGEVVPRKVMTLSLSIDHRVIDGAEAAQFVNTVKEYLETPELLLLE
jgi:pyruvate dehydrogenase E2 component (dihydrolipoamide acetyltransferase)